MKTLIAITCIAVLAAVGYYFWGEYSRYSAHAAAEFSAQQRAELDRIEAWEAEKARLDAEDRDRLAELGQDGCNQAAIDVLWLSGMKTIRSRDDLTSRLANDIRICISQNKLLNSDTEKIRQAGLFDILTR